MALSQRLSDACRRVTCNYVPGQSALALDSGTAAVDSLVSQSARHSSSRPNDSEPKRNTAIVFRHCRPAIHNCAAASFGDVRGEGFHVEQVVIGPVRGERVADVWGAACAVTA